MTRGKIFWVMLGLGMTALLSAGLLQWQKTSQIRRVSEPPLNAVELTLVAEIGTWPQARQERFIDQLSQEMRQSVKEAAEYIMRNQAASGELPYQYNIDEVSWGEPGSRIRQIAGAGFLFNACRVSGREDFCEAGERALLFYRTSLVTNPTFPGECFNSGSYCQSGGNALFIDAVYKRWQATGSTQLQDWDLLTSAVANGENLIWLRKDNHGVVPVPNDDTDACERYFFYHQLDVETGEIISDRCVVYFDGESLMALLELYEMTGDPKWLSQARELNDYMVEQRVLEDHWHAYAFELFSKLDGLTEADREYAREIANRVIDREVRSLAPGASSISTATKLEASSAIALALSRSGENHEFLLPEIVKFYWFVDNHQLPNNSCGWIEVAGFLEGGVYRDCDETYIRIDANQHFGNGMVKAIEYLEFLANE